MPSQNMGSNTSFNFEYALTIIIVLVVCNTLMKKSPQMSSAIVVITGLLVGYISLLLINKLSKISCPSSTKFLRATSSDAISK